MQSALTWINRPGQPVEPDPRPLDWIFDESECVGDQVLAPSQIAGLVTQHDAHPVPPLRVGLRHRTGERLIVLGFGGDAWDADSLAARLHGLFPDADVIAFHYCGYRPSTGSPSAAVLLADAPLFL